MWLEASSGTISRVWSSARRCQGAWQEGVPRWWWWSQRRSKDQPGRVCGIVSAMGVGWDLVFSGEKGFVAVRAVGAGRVVSRTTRPGLHGSERRRCIQATRLHLARSAGLLQETREGTACTRLPAVVAGLKWDFRGVLFSFCPTRAEWLSQILHLFCRAVLRNWGDFFFFWVPQGTLSNI